jgi:ABC-type bacteriocin/lantibiotic exporter with double-glycine peptidase domain
MFSDVLFQSYLCATYPIKESWLEQDNLPRPESLTPKEFEAQFDALNRPVVVATGAAFQRAQRKWSWQYMRKILTDKDMQVGAVASASFMLSIFHLASAVYPFCLAVDIFRLS